MQHERRIHIHSDMKGGIWIHEEGTDPATVKECDDLLDAISQARQLANGRAATLTAFDALGKVIFSERL